MKRVFRAGLAAVIALAVLVAGGAAQTTQAVANPRVVFVCEHGAAKAMRPNEMQSGKHVERLIDQLQKR